MRVLLRIRLRDRRPPFIYPMAMPLRTVTFERLFRRDAYTAYVDPDSPDAASLVNRQRPAVLAGRVETLLDFEPRLSSLPTHGLVVFTGEGSRCLPEELRDALWDAYRVPVFEEVITAHGRLAAWECEAHEGLHLALGAYVPRGCISESGECACGHAGLRIFNARIAPGFTAPLEPSRLLLPNRIAPATRSVST
jgi:hypothetical protein